MLIGRPMRDKDLYRQIIRRYRSKLTIYNELIGVGQPLFVHTVVRTDEQFFLSSFFSVFQSLF